MDASGAFMKMILADCAGDIHRMFFSLFFSERKRVWWQVLVYRELNAILCNTQLFLDV